MAIRFLNDGSFPDNIKLEFGDSQDLEIYSDGTDGILYAKVDDLVLKAEDDVFVQVKGGEDGIKVIGDGAVELYYDNVKKFSTSSGGVTIQGTNSDILFVSDNTDYNYLQVFVPDTVVNALGVSQTNVKIPIAFEVDGISTFNNNVTIPADNNKLRIGAGNDLELYHNGTNSFIENATGDLYIDSNGDDLYLQSDDDVIIRSQGSENAVYCTGNAGVALYHNNSSKFTTTSSGVTVTGNCTLSSDGNLVLDPDSGIQLNTFDAPGAGAEGNGIIIKLHSTTTTFGKIYYKSNFAAAWSLADADSDGATRMLGVALGTSSLNDGMLLQGLIRIASHGLSAGAPLYVSTTAGEFTTTAPSGSGDYVRVVGYTIDSNIIYFNPSGTWVEVS